MKYLRVLIPKVLFLAFIVGMGGLALGQGSSDRRVSPSPEVRQEVFTHQDFMQLTPEKQAYVLNNPKQYRVLDEEGNPIQKQLSCSKAKAQTVSPTRVSAQELSKMEPAKQALIKGNPDMYQIVDGPVVPEKQKFYASELLDMDEAVRNRIISRTDVFEVESTRMRSENVQKMDVSTRTFIENNANLFIIE